MAETTDVTLGMIAPYPKGRPNASALDRHALLLAAVARTGVDLPPEGCDDMAAPPLDELYQAVSEEGERMEQRTVRSSTKRRAHRRLVRRYSTKTTVDVLNRIASLQEVASHG